MLHRQRRATYLHYTLCIATLSVYFFSVEPKIHIEEYVYFVWSRIKKASKNLIFFSSYASVLYYSEVYTILLGYIPKNIPFGCTQNV